MKLKRILIAVLALALSVVAFGACTACEQDTGIDVPPPVEYDFTIGILSGSRIPAFELGAPGFQDRLTELMEAAGYRVRFDYQNALGDGATSTTIAQNFAAQRVDLMFVLGTGASQAALPVATMADIPLVFGIITDPIGAGLISDISTGSSSALPMSTQVDLLAELIGSELNAQNRVAFLYTTDEDNSVASLARLQAAAPEDTIIPFGIPNNGLDQLMPHFISIAADPTIRAIYIPQDNQITRDMGLVQNLNRSQSDDSRLPIVVADLPIVADGAIASLSVDFAANGARAAEMAFEILVNGNWPENFYAPAVEALSLYLNATEAEYIGFEIPETLTERATRTF